MHSANRVSILVWSLALLAGLAGSRLAVAGADEAVARIAALEAASDTLDQALRTNDVEALSAQLADDVFLMPPGEAPVRGKQATREWYVAFLSRFRTTSLTVSDREVLAGEGWAVVRGTREWSFQPAAGGDPVVHHGNYMQVWKRQADGRWLFYRGMWNSTAPPSAR